MFYMVRLVLQKIVWYFLLRFGNIRYFYDLCLLFRLVFVLISFAVHHRSEEDVWHHKYWDNVVLQDILMSRL